VAGHHAGIMTGPDGATHQATEDIAITRVWPKMTVLVPCDSIQAKKTTIRAGEIDGPVYLRFTRDKTPIMTTLDTPFEMNKIQTFWISDAPVATIFSTGYMTYYALQAAKELEEEQIHVEVVNVPGHTFEFIKKLQGAVNRSGAAVTVEDHQIEGGLGGAIAELLSEKRPTKMKFIGLRNTFAESGKTQELLAKYKMDTQAIKEAVRNIIKK